MKKFIASALAAVMVIMPSASLTGAAEKALPEEAIGAARAAFEIGAELTEFSYDTYSYGEEVEYSFNWRDKEDKESVSVQINSDLVPVNYSYALYEESSGLSTIRKKDMEQTARAFMEKAIPALSGNLVLNETDSGTNRFVYDRYENGVRVESNRAVVYVSKVSGKVTDYNLTWDFENEFKGTDSLGKEKAYERLAESGTVTEYRILDNKAIPVYAQKYNTYVSASDGTPFEANRYADFNYKKEFYSTMDAVMEAEGNSSGGGYRLTAQERTAVEKMSSLISEEKLTELIASMPEVYVPQSYEMSLNYFTQRYEDEADKYFVRCSLEGGEEGYASFRFDAETGELRGYDSYNGKSYEFSENPVADDVLADAADGFLSRIKSLEGYRLKENEYENRNTFTRRYIRYVGEIPYPSDYMSVTLSKNTGKIIGYSENKPTAEIVTPASLFDKAAAVRNNFEAELVYAYAMTETDILKSSTVTEYTSAKPVLAYKLNPIGDFYCIDAADGRALDYGGKAYELITEKTDETDHWAWETFDLLRENGIYVEGRYSFDDEIKKSDFRKLISGLRRIDAVPYRYYDVPEEDEEEQKPIDREEAAKIIAFQMGWEKLIDLDIYSVKFKDAAEFKGGVGAAAILQGLGVMTGNDAGFAPNEKLTYAQAYALTYRMAQFAQRDKVSPIMW